MLDETLYRDLAENSLGLMCVHDLNGVLFWVNRAAQDALGYSLDAAIGQNLESFLPAQVKPQFADYLERIRRNSSDAGLLHLVTADGSDRIWSYRNVLVRTAEGPRVLGHALDISDRVQAERELKLNRDRLESLFQDAPIAYLEIDPEGRVRRVNRAACDLLGCTDTDLPGRMIWEFMDERHQGRAVAAFHAMLTRGAPAMTEVFAVHGANGHDRSVEVHVNAILDRHGDITGARCAMLDITERLRAEEQVRLMNLELEARVAERTAELLRSNAELQQFAYVVSHDLQSPLRQLEILLTGSDEPDRIQTSLTITERMKNLVSRLLEYSIATQSPLRPAKSVDVRQVVDESLANLQSAVEESHARIEILELPTVLADPTTLVQVFQNLISNALKYARSDHLVVRISAAERPEDWVFAVEDNGPGIAPNLQERVFQAFRRLHGSDIPGAGVGLAICKKVVERNGGRIWVESQPGRGTAFRFTVPK